VNRYSLREWSHNSIDQADSHNDSKTFEMFVHEVNIQDKYNKVNGPILAVPIVAYHMIDNTKAPYSTDVTLFDREMKYLHDNAFKVLTVNDLGYDTKNNFLYIKPSVVQSTAANPVSLTTSPMINVTRMNVIVPKESSAITPNNTAIAPLSLNRSSYLFHPMSRINHLSLPINSKSSPPSSSGHHQSIYGKNYHGLRYYITSQASTAGAHHKVTVPHKVHAASKVHHKVIAVIPEMHGEPTTTAVHKKVKGTTSGY
jgi:hypothetical protein